ncbi:hypothetical protein LCGC14_2440570 [marine sediment metagenome]|uniref:Uncharacterized protein n=1 Tax=marine sediment metagenome TaxID=412755 RepID=A0A0F9BJ87_9ZZZZ
MIKSIVHDRVPNTSTGMMLGRAVVVGRGITCEDGEGRIVKVITEEKDTHDRPIIIITCTDGYQIVIPDKNIYKEYEFK